LRGDWTRQVHTQERAVPARAVQSGTGLKV
jgi:hypothetical protein